MASLEKVEYAFDSDCMVVCQKKKDEEYYFYLFTLLRKKIQKCFIVTISAAHQC